MATSTPPNDKAQRISVDLDGVLNLGETYRGPNHFAPVRTGARNFLTQLHNRGFEIVIHTARPVHFAKTYLRENDLMRYVNDVTNEKLPSRIYVDDRGLKFEGDFERTLRAVDEFKTHWEGGKPKFDSSTVMVVLSPEDADAVREIAEKIDPKDLHPKGKEKSPHLTVKFGLQQDAPGELPEKLKGKAKAKVGKMSVFEGEDKDVLKLDVDSEDLNRLNAEVCKLCPHTDSHPEYHPHITVAYLRKGAGKKYAGHSSMTGRHLEFSRFSFSGKDGKMADFPL